MYISALGMCLTSSSCRWYGYSTSLVMPTTIVLCLRDARTSV